jgi:CheY-like chemotaxis protein
VFRPLTQAVRKLAVTARSCAHCGSPEIRPSNRRNALDILLACVFLAPFRCRVCRGRFYRMWRPSLQRPPVPPAAPLLVMPQRAVDPKPSPPPPAVAPVSTSPDFAAPGAVLILEDDLSIRKLLRRLLERRGHFTVEIAQADDLAAEMLDRRVDLLIVDVSTVEAGVEAVFEFARALPSLKILAISGEPVRANEIQDRLLVLPKPFPLDSFVDGVDRLLARSSASDTVS